MKSISRGSGFHLGRYQVQSHAQRRAHDPLKPEAMRTLSLGPGETAVLIQRVMP